MLTHVEFRSDRFLPIEGEDQLVNPGVWGKTLADFLRRELQKAGIQTNEPIAEDWGWVVPVVNTSFRLWIGCSNYGEYPAGFLCFIEPHKPYVRKLFRKIDTRERVTEIQQALDKILCDEAGVLTKRWWTHEEFQNQPRVQNA